MLSDDIGLSVETDAAKLFQWYLDFFDLESAGNPEEQSTVLAHVLRALGLPSLPEPASS
jgi:hypothetical protein